MTRDTDETMPEELREAIESERLWDDLPPELEERLARRIGESLAAREVAPSPEPRAVPVEPVVRSEAITRRGLPAVVRRATSSLKWGVVLAGGLLAAGAMGAGLVVVVIKVVAPSEAPAPSEDPPKRGTRPARRAGPRAPQPPPPAPAEELEAAPEELDVPIVVPELPPLPPAPTPSAAPPSPPMPAAPERPRVKRVPPPSPVEAPPAPARSHARPASERDWSLLLQAREASAQGRYPEALSAISQHEQEYPSSQLEQEREALRIHALVGLGRRDEARVLARRFAQHFPESMLLEGIREAVGEK